MFQQPTSIGSLESVTPDYCSVRVGEKRDRTVKDCNHLATQAGVLQHLLMELRFL